MQEAGPETMRVLDSGEGCKELPIIEGKGYARVVVWPGNGAKFRSLHLLSLEDGASTVPLRHGSDCVYYVVAGEGSIMDAATENVQPLAEGGMVHIDGGDCYRLMAKEGGAMRLVGGPCPADPALYDLLPGR